MSAVGQSRHFSARRELPLFPDQRTSPIEKTVEQHHHHLER